MSSFFSFSKLYTNFRNSQLYKLEIEKIIISCFLTNLIHDKSRKINKYKLINLKILFLKQLPNSLLTLIYVVYINSRYKNMHNSYEIERKKKERE